MNNLLALSVLVALLAQPLHIVAKGIGGKAGGESTPHPVHEEPHPVHEEPATHPDNAPKNKKPPKPNAGEGEDAPEEPSSPPSGPVAKPIQPTIDAIKKAHSKGVEVSNAIKAIVEKKAGLTKEAADAFNQCTTFYGTALGNIDQAIGATSKVPVPYNDVRFLLNGAIADAAKCEKALVDSRVNDPGFPNGPTNPNSAFWRLCTDALNTIKG